MIDPEYAKDLGDRAAYLAGSGASLAWVTELTDVITGVLSIIFLLMSIFWLGWRMWDKRFGKKTDDG